MTIRTNYTPGEFAWVDLMTTDITAAKAFYAELFGWGFHDEYSATDPYTIFTCSGYDVAGMAEMPDDMRSAGMPSAWQSYVSVLSADDAVKRATKLGGTPLMDVMEIEEGRFAAIADPQGAVLAIWEPKSYQGAVLSGEPVSACWNELLAKDVEKAEEYYAELFGWQYDTQDMGGMAYTTISNEGQQNGGMMQIAEEMGSIPPHWGVYFAVADCDATAASAARLGGRVNLDPKDIPPGRFAHLADPTGAMFYVLQLNA